MAYQDRFSYFAPTRLIVGRGTIDEIPAILSQKQIRNPLIVTDAGLVKAGLVERVLARLGDTGHTVFDGVEANPPIPVVHACADHYRDNACDGFIAIGGGSSMDVAKTAGVLIANGGKIQDYFGPGKVETRIPFCLCVPTTYGTASEVTPFAVVTDDANYKAAVIGPHIIPDVGILDADMAVALPMPIAGATGMDALTHAIESFVALTANPISDGLALHAMRLIASNLRQAAASDHNHDATLNMLIASNVAGIAFSQTRLGNVHAMSHPVSGHFGVPHGVANAILLTRIMDFNLVACPGRFAQIGVALGADVEGLDEIESGRCAVEAVAALAQDVGIPPNLTDVGVDPKAISVMAEDAMKSGNIAINPRKTTLKDVVNLYEEAM